ncbi:MAG: hypothetical protein Q9163_000955 [Psora crenata]
MRISSTSMTSEVTREGETALLPILTSKLSEFTGPVVTSLTMSTMTSNEIMLVASSNNPTPLSMTTSTPNAMISIGLQPWSTSTLRISSQLNIQTTEEHLPTSAEPTKEPASTPRLGLAEKPHPYAQSDGKPHRPINPQPQLQPQPNEHTPRPETEPSPLPAPQANPPGHVPSLQPPIQNDGPPIRPAPAPQNDEAAARPQKDQSAPTPPLAQAGPQEQTPSEYAPKVQAAQDNPPKHQVAPAPAPATQPDNIPPVPIGALAPGAPRPFMMNATSPTDNLRPFTNSSRPNGANPSTVERQQLRDLAFALRGAAIALDVDPSLQNRLELATLLNKASNLTASITGLDDLANGLRAEESALNDGEADFRKDQDLAINMEQAANTPLPQSSPIPQGTGIPKLVRKTTRNPAVLSRSYIDAAATTSVSSGRTMLAAFLPLFFGGLFLMW